MVVAIRDIHVAIVEFLMHEVHAMFLQVAAKYSRAELQVEFVPPSDVDI